MSEYESVVLVKPEVFVYRIPPLGSSRGYKAADWKLDNPDFVGRLRLVSKSNTLVLKLEDKTTGELFAKCPIDKYPGTAVEAVLDSSRYFVVRLVDDSGRTAIIGMGFADRGDSFDLNVALQDYFKYLEKDAKLNQELTQEAEKPKLDLSFKEGQTITINLGKKTGTGVSRPRTAGTSSPGGFALPPPPPPAGSRVAAAVSSSSTSSFGGSAENSPRGSPGPTMFAQTGRPGTAPQPPPPSITSSFQPVRQNLDFFGGPGSTPSAQMHQGQIGQAVFQSAPSTTNPFMTSSSSLFQPMPNAAAPVAASTNQQQAFGGGGGDSSVGNLLDL